MYVFPDVLAFSIYKIKLLEFQKKYYVILYPFSLHTYPDGDFYIQYIVNILIPKVAFFKLFVVIIDRYLLLRIVPFFY